MHAIPSAWLLFPPPAQPIPTPPATETRHPFDDFIPASHIPLQHPWPCTMPFSPQNDPSLAWGQLTRRSRLNISAGRSSLDPAPSRRGLRFKPVPRRPRRPPSGSNKWPFHNHGCLCDRPVNQLTGLLGDGTSQATGPRVVGRGRTAARLSGWGVSGIGRGPVIIVSVAPVKTKGVEQKREWPQSLARARRLP